MWVGFSANRRSKGTRRHPVIDVAVVFLEGGHASTAIGPLEVFRDAGSLWNLFTRAPPDPRFRVRSASIGGRPVRTDAPFAIAPDESLESLGAPDLVFVPSAGVDLDALLERNAPVIEYLREAHAAGSRIAGVCSGVALLAASGLLDGRSATTHWGLIDRYRERFPRADWCPDALVTEADGIYCGAGVHAALDLALYLVERFCDHTIAVQASKALLIDMPRECQTGFAVLPMGARHGDARIERAEAWIHRHCREDFRFEALARELGMSPRNFIRRFKSATGISPVDYLQRLRVSAAKRLLEGEHVTVQEVGTAVGYGDAAFFRSLFKRHTGLAPAAYRRRFGSALPRRPAADTRR
jgi:transcriptional regulator GlxA family with amidase domain